MRRKGIILIYFLLIYSIVAMLCSTLLLNSYRVYQQVNNEYLTWKAFYLAEAGKVIAKDKIQNNSNWYTDLLETNAIGENYAVDNGFVNIIRVFNKKELYATGYLGDNIANSKAIARLKITFSLPFSLEAWARI